MTQFVAFSETEVNLEINSMSYEPPKTPPGQGSKLGRASLLLLEETAQRGDRTKLTLHL